MSDKEFIPAFPILDDCNGLGLHLRHGGMSLRDYFAAKALQGLLASPDCVSSTDKLVGACYQIADAMMKAREL